MFLATAIRTDDGLVTDDYYKKGKAINMELRRDKQAFNMGLSAQLMVGSPAHAALDHHQQGAAAGGDQHAHGAPGPG